MFVLGFLLHPSADIGRVLVCEGVHERNEMGVLTMSFDAAKN